MVIDHLIATPGIREPWISTSKSKRFCASGAQSPGNLDCYVYTIDPRANGLTLKDAEREFERKRLPYPRPAEREISVKKWIPWANIIEWDIYRGCRKVGTVTRQARVDFARQMRRTPTPPGGGRSRSNSPGRQKRSVIVIRAFTA
ncbi:hypothetical protein PspLS_07641 [Pyricularia sp. CBS 133598]|nr:hypothetical protein PspLS_07641 [Pyricularia sp. CBS 133598]